MNAEDRISFAEVVIGFAELKGKQLSAPAIELYWNAMQHWTLADFRAAANHLLRTCEFMPTPKDFEDLRKAGRMTSGEAWLRAVACCTSARIPGGHQGGTSGDSLIDRAVRAIGGYGAIAMCDLDKLPFMERRFCEHYAEMEDVGDTRESVPQIAKEDAKKALGQIHERLVKKDAA